jgi:acetamidase/formamidase
MGVAPKEPGEVSIRPPGRFGGNLDIRHLTKGNTLFLPVQVDGAKFSAGDCHSAHLQLDEPQFICNGPINRKIDAKGYYCTMGIGPDLYKNAQKAIGYMIQHLVDQYNITREEAYILCSVTVDLKISEIVNRPNWLVSAYLPLSVFV